jgi:hypothetical protein
MQDSTVDRLISQLCIFDNTPEMDHLAAMDHLSAMNNNLSAMNNNLSAMNNNLSAMGNSLSAMNNNLSTMGNSLSTMGNSLSTMGNNLSTMGNNLAPMNNLSATTNASANEHTPIAKLVSSWTDLSVEVDVEDSGASVNEPKVAKWRLSRVKQRLERPDVHAPILCPRLKARAVVSMVLDVNKKRSNEARGRQWLADHDSSLLLPYLILGQKGAGLGATWSKLETVITVDEGSVLVLYSAKPLKAEDKAKLENSRALEKDLMHYAPTSIALKPGNIFVLPPYKLYSIMFMDQSLLNMSPLVPLPEPQENEQPAA